MCQGQVNCAEGVVAVFAELSSSASSMDTTTLFVTINMLPGCVGGQPDADQACRQACIGHGETSHTETWARLPRGMVANGLSH